MIKIATGVLIKNKRKEEKRMKKTKLLFATLGVSAILSMTSFAGEWKQDNTGWWYQNDDGTYPVSSWFQDCRLEMVLF